MGFFLGGGRNFFVIPSTSSSGTLGSLSPVILKLFPSEVPHFRSLHDSRVKDAIKDRGPSIKSSEHIQCQDEEGVLKNMDVFYFTDVRSFRLLSGPGASTNRRPVSYEEKLAGQAITFILIFCRSPEHQFKTAR